MEVQSSITMGACRTCGLGLTGHLISEHATIPSAHPRSIPTVSLYITIWYYLYVVRAYTAPKHRQLLLGPCCICSVPSPLHEMAPMYLLRFMACHHTNQIRGEWFSFESCRGQIRPERAGELDSQQYIPTVPDLEEIPVPLQTMCCSLSHWCCWL